ncbi:MULTISPECIES: hypothetical protein [Pseudomonas]|uniref:Ig-like domain-containing protein n=1 Tax=Pseudomonas nitroreducens TaxID=46680 RepID=A0A246FDM8_PSENT|nr:MULTISPECIES: hypothetical protein [Pseudomonas]MCG8908668.1 hypothetical protein [Pseudomonas sp. DP-17]MDU4250407.1 hypothetical protein [Pseudomonas sp.]OWP52427.1 hypothetical protein CEG18_00920 [Pseudomonas nitroreducens]
MSSLRRLSGLLLLPLCSLALADETTPFESCLAMAVGKVAADPKLQERWQQTWIEPGSIREEAYEGQVDGKPASKRLVAQLRRGEQSDGEFVCLLGGDGKALSVSHADDTGVR